MKIVMLVNNDCSRDSRVIREAEALAFSGNDVHVLAHSSPDLPDEELNNRVLYKRVPFDLIGIWGGRRSPESGTFSAKRGWFLSAFASMRFFPASSVACAINRDSGLVADYQNGVASRLLAKLTYVPESIGRFTKRCVKVGVKTLVTPFGAELLRHWHGYTRPGIALKPNVVHAHDLYTLLAGYRIARATGAKLVYDSHELETGRNGSYSRWDSALRAMVERFLIKRSDAVVTVCDSIANHLRDLYSIPRPVVVLNAPADEEFVHRSKSINGIADLRSVLGLSECDELAVYVGKVTFNRGLEQCVRALEHYPSLHFATVGPRDPQTAKELLEIAGSLGVRDRLHLVEPVPYKEVTGFVRTAGVSLIPIQGVCLSYQFCFPNKLLESLLSGVPVVVSNLVELRRMVETTGCGVTVDETDPRSIAYGIKTVLQDRDRYAPDQQKIKSLRETYSWDRQREVLGELYRDLSVIRTPP